MKGVNHESVMIDFENFMISASERVGTKKGLFISLNQKCLLQSTLWLSRCI